ncbi:Phosphotransferase system HPr-related protein [Halapricum desulfuricans]|uniref:Phosphotransferase system HPr-related protein n=2 Tax=Halapricum desulfuricans TaxID=2841257 RepID=A0A897MZ75_9EURY|nr:Phosphotransferase system HPr-related protein [Halapricum desulfuricans]
MMERTVTIVPEAGLHARPASKLVETANEFESELQIATDGAEPVDARSMLAVSSMAAEQGEAVRLIADGPDAEAALDALEKVLTTPEDEYDE